MKFEFDSSSLAEVQAIRAACDHLLGCLTPERQILDDVVAKLKAWSDDGPPVASSGAACDQLLGSAGASDMLHVGEAVRPAAVSADEKAAAAAVSAVDEIVQHAGLIPTHAPERIADPDDATHAVPGVDIPGPQDMALDSAGQPWNPELHSSSRAKVADGTWKKRRNAKTAEQLAEETGLPAEGVAERLSAPQPPATSNGEYDPAHVPTPPVPPAPPTAEVVTMNQIWALITNKTHTLDDVLKASQAMGFADLGAVAQTATAEQRAQLYKELTA